MCTLKKIYKEKNIVRNKIGKQFENRNSIVPVGVYSLLSVSLNEWDVIPPLS